MGGFKPGVGGAGAHQLPRKKETENWDWTRLEGVEPMIFFGAQRGVDGCLKGRAHTWCSRV